MKIINTNKLLEAINNVGEFEEKIRPEVPASFADAVKGARELEKKAEKVFADKEKEAKNMGLNNTEKDRLEGNTNIKKSEGSKKLHLEESLFEESAPAVVTIEDWGYDPEDDVYEELFKDKVLAYRKKWGRL